MPPRGGHGGHGHGGHGGGGHHHHHGGRPGGWQGGWGPGWSYPGVWGAQPAYAELVVPSCPDVVDQVLASDGRTYLNACLANQAGARVVKHLGAQKMNGLGALTAGQKTGATALGFALSGATGAGIGALVAGRKGAMWGAGISLGISAIMLAMRR